MAKKIKLAYSGSNFALLPPISDVVSLFGGPASTPAMIRMIARHRKLDKPPAGLDKKTLNKAFDTGVSSRVADKITDFMIDVNSDCKYLSIDELVRMLQENTAERGNGPVWLASIQGLKEGLQRSAPDKPLLRRTISFIEGRIEVEAHIFRVAQQADVPLYIKLLLDAVKNHTLINYSNAEKSLSILPMLRVDGECCWLLSSEEGETIEVFCLQFYLDFYFSLLVCIELDVIEDSFVASESCLASELYDGLLSEVFTKSIDNEKRKINQAFENLLDHWRESRSLSWSQIAEYIPDPEPMRSRIPCKRARSPEKIKETKNRRLHEWRNDTMPTDDQLERFINNLIPEKDGQFYHFVIAKLVLGWGRLLHRFLEKKTKYINHQDILNHFKCYSEYRIWMQSRLPFKQPE
ncbi:hypothetical protein [Zobellella aerophila]|uniref:Uncharacterized protein n=1 Tax=Zobellella aerophila TaxID=870480 RepID=A0ABP6V7H0_9GAMM